MNYTMMHGSTNIKLSRYLYQNPAILYFKIYLYFYISRDIIAVRIALSVQRLATTWTVRPSNTGRKYKFYLFQNHHERLWGLRSPLFNEDWE